MEKINAPLAVPVPTLPAADTSDDAGDITNAQYEKFSQMLSVFSDKLFSRSDYH